MRIVLSSSTNHFLGNVALKTYPDTARGTRSKHYMKTMEVMYGKICREHIPFDEFMEIPKNYWTKAVGNHYQKYLKELIQLGAIETDNSYSTKSKVSKKYRLNQELAYSSPMLLKFKDRSEKLHNTKDPVIVKTIKNLQRIKTTYSSDEDMYKIVESDINYAYLKSKGLQVNFIPSGKFWLYAYDSTTRQNEKVVSFPMEGKKIWWYVNDRKQIPILWKNRIYLVDDPKEWIRKKIIEIQHYYLQSLCNFRYIRNRKNIICSRNETNGRLDTNLTNTPSMIFKYLKVDGEQLFNADLKNSQLTFFGILTYYLHRIDNVQSIFSTFLMSPNDTFPSFPSIYEKVIMNIINNKEDIKNNRGRGICGSIQTKEDSTTNYLSIDYSSFLGKKKAQIFDKIQVFRKLCFSGRYYETMAGLMYDTRYKGTFSKCATFADLERKMKYAKSINHEKHGVIGGAVQIRPNIVTFGKTKESYTREFKAIRADVKLLTFQTIFSSYRFTNDLKTILKKEYPAAIYFIDSFKKKYGSNQFSILLQTLESHVFIDGIYAECLERDIVCYTKHDSVLFKMSDYPKIMHITLKHLNAFFGKGNYKLEIEAPKQ